MAKSKKQKQQKRIAKIIADGRVTAKEAKKAAKQGISLARIQKAQTKSFKPGNVFSRPGTSTPIPNAMEVARGTYKAPATPAYSPLTIQGSAQKVFDRGTAAAPAPAPAPAPPPPDPDPGPGYDMPVQPVYNPFEDFLNTLPGMLDAMQPEPYEPLPPPTTYASIGQAAQSAPGVKARRSSASRRLQSSLGTRGSFNRGGLRISNLNI